MSANTSPSMSSLSSNSPPMANSADTDTTSRSSASPDDPSTNPDVNHLLISNDSKDLPWILHRILKCQLSCELPLRIMFAYNSGQKLPSLKQAHRWWQYGAQGKLIIQFLSSQEKITPSLEDTAIEGLKSPPCGPTESISPDHHPRDRFMDRGNDLLLDIDFTAIEQGRRQSEGLPPGFVQKLCLDIFAEDYEEADFSQALAGLDYIRDLEVTRRASLREAAQRLGITKENWREILADDPDAKKWVENMQALEVDIATYYATIFIDLRIWTMINELQCKSFYKPNVLAMLNTLFPPCVKELPNNKIEKSVLHKHRAHLYQYILTVDKQGPSVLKHFVEGLLKPGTKHSWPEARKNLELYFERAENMITASTAIHSIQFFRDHASKYSGSTPSLSERPETSDSGNTTVNSQLNHKSKTSTISSVPRMPAISFDSTKSRQRIHSRHKISTPADQQTYFEPVGSQWASQQMFLNSSNPGSSHGAMPMLRNASRSITPLADTNSLKSRTCPPSQPTTPFVEQGSEAAQHDSFTRPITPFEDKRREVIARRETISDRSTDSLELSHTFSHIPEMGSHYNSRPGLGSRKTISRSVSSVKTPLPNDNFEFLNRQYEPEPPCHSLSSTPPEMILKMKPSFGNFFPRKKSSVASIATLRNNDNNDSPNALGIEMAALAPLTLRPTRSIESFPRFSQDPLSERRTLRKQINFSSLQKSDTRVTMHSIRSCTASGMTSTGLVEIAEDEQLKKMLKKKSSLPNLRSKRFYEKATDGAGGIDHFFIQTGDDYERYRHMAIPRPATSQGPKKKEIRKAKSFALLCSWATAGPTETKKTVRAHKSSLFRREPTEGEKIRGKTISEPFPTELQNDPALLAPESRSKEYTRKWFIEEARAQRYGLNKPEGDPIKEDENFEKKELDFLFLRKKREEVVMVEKPFEMPRATPKLPTRPNKQRWNSIFPRRALPKRQKPTTHTPIDLSKYVKYPGKGIV